MESKKQRLIYAKSIDLYKFGLAIFDMMIGKDSAESTVTQVGGGSNVYT